ncbi:hypothetical protein C3E93_28655, partial [Klebsiella pneumoniae]
NNTQPQTGLVNGSDKQPRATLWQMGDTLIALLAARTILSRKPAWSTAATNSPAQRYGRWATPLSPCS